MPFFWRRRVKEKAMQGLSMGRDFDKTPNDKLKVTYRQLKHFADALRKFDSHTETHLKGIKGYYEHTAGFLETELPRMGDVTNEGETQVLGEEGIVGADVDVHKMRRAADEGKAEIYKHVQEPLRLWLSNFQTVTNSIAAAESLRLVVDSRRRTLQNLEGQLAKAEEKQRDASDKKVENLKDKKHRQEMKLKEAQDDHARKEQSVYDNMRRLINDVKFVHVHIHKMFEELRNVNTHTCEAFPKGSMDSDLRKSGAFLKESAEHLRGEGSSSDHKVKLSEEHGHHGHHGLHGNRMDGEEKGVKLEHAH